MQEFRRQNSQFSKVDGKPAWFSMRRWAKGARHALVQDRRASERVSVRLTLKRRQFSNCVAKDEEIVSSLKMDEAQSVTYFVCPSTRVVGWCFADQILDMCEKRGK
jgi:hypothetical protein